MDELNNKKLLTELINLWWTIRGQKWVDDMLKELVTLQGYVEMDNDEVQDLLSTQDLGEHLPMKIMLYSGMFRKKVGDQIHKQYPKKRLNVIEAFKSTLDNPGVKKAYVESLAEYIHPAPPVISDKIQTIILDDMFGDDMSWEIWKVGENT
tara:strand:- start:362 stop:814 length:453 start_codon:yes stop_codon:yes gene_type:complete